MSDATQVVGTGAGPEAAVLDREIRLYVQLRADHEKAQEEEKRLKKLRDEQEQRLFDVMESCSLKTANHDLGRLTRYVTVRAKVDDDGALAESLNSRGLLDAFTKRAWRQKELNDYARELEEQGEPLPDGMDTWRQRSVRYTSAKGATGALEG